MDESAARARGEEIRPEVPVPESFELESVKQRIIELEGQARDAASVADRLVWVLRFQGSMRLVEVALDDATGEVVRVQWSK